MIYLNSLKHWGVSSFILEICMKEHKRSWKLKKEKTMLSLLSLTETPTKICTYKKYYHMKSKTNPNIKSSNSIFSTQCTKPQAAENHMLLDHLQNSQKKHIS